MDLSGSPDLWSVAISSYHISFIKHINLPKVTSVCSPCSVQAQRWHLSNGPYSLVHVKGISQELSILLSCPWSLHALPHPSHISQNASQEHISESCCPFQAFTWQAAQQTPSLTRAHTWTRPTRTQVESYFNPIHELRICLEVISSSEGRHQVFSYPLCLYGGIGSAHEDYQKS